MGELVEALGPGPLGRVDLARALTARLFGGELASVSMASLLNGANVAAVRSEAGEWEVLQFANAEEIEPNVWRMTKLLRAQLGTEDAMQSGHAAGAPFVLLNSAVVSAGLSPEQCGLLLNWRVGPAGQTPGSRNFIDVQEVGGIRARLPLSPVHLKAVLQDNGSVGISWTRRGRIDADSWLAEEIPLGEESEKYRIEIADEAGEVQRSTEVFGPSWTYLEELALADFPDRPCEVEVIVQQVSSSVGGGIPARRRVMLT